MATLCGCSRPGRAVTTAGLSVLTLIWHDWLEAFGLEPDHHSGEAEVLIVLALLTCSVALAVTAGLEWRKTITASTS